MGISKVSPNNLKTKSVVIKPTCIIPTKATLYNPSETKHYNHKPILVWRPKTEQGVSLSFTSHETKQYIPTLHQSHPGKSMSVPCALMSTVMVSTVISSSNTVDPEPP